MKKGFTLIEIIVVIALVSVIGVGTSVAVIKASDKKETDILISNQKTFETALEVYLETHSEVLNNVNDKYEGAIITLETLKNEGLIKDNLKISYEDNYYVVSNALLSKTPNLEKNVVKEECDNSVRINRVASWAEDYDTSSVLYFCPKKVVNSYIDNNTPWKKEDCSKPEYKDTLACTIINIAKFNASKLSDGAISNMTHVDYGSVYKEIPLTTPGKEISKVDRVVVNDKYNEKYYETENTIPNSFEVTYHTSTFQNKTVYYGENYKIADSKTIDNNGPFIITDVKTFDIGIANDEDTYPEAIKKLKNLEGKYVYISDYPNDHADDYLSGKFITSSSYSGYYAKLTAGPGVPYVFKINKVEGKDVKGTGMYSHITYKNKDVTFTYSLIFPEIYIAERTLSKTQDEYGDSYYFRGDVKDNYINYAGMCWRIVRVAGDGSVKLVLEDAYANCNSDNYTGNFIYGSFNTTTYTGRVSRDDDIFIEYFPTAAQTAGASELEKSLYNKLLNFQKEILERNINSESTKKFSDFLKHGDWCYADSTDKTTTRYEDTKTALANGITKLECPQIKYSNFDKNTKMYAGALLAEEVALAGGSTKGSLDYYLMNFFTLSNYIYDGYRRINNYETLNEVEWYTITPYRYHSSESPKEIYSVYSDGYLAGHDAAECFWGGCQGPINYRPAINLIKNIKVNSGKGTRLEPYEIDFN